MLMSLRRKLEACSLGNEKGLTLIELMFSVLIMTLVLLSAFYVLSQAHYMSEESRNRLLALNAARTTLEAIKNTPLAGVPNIATAGFVPNDLPGGAIVIQTTPSPIGAATVATVTVTVSWVGVKSRAGDAARTLELTTMRSIF